LIPKLLTQFIARIASPIFLIAVPAMAASLDLANHPAAGGPGKFAAEEIRRAAAAQCITLGEDSRATSIAISVEKEGQAAAQGYSIRVRNDGGCRTITVRGADAAGAMYGGLDVAEAIRTGTLDALKDSDHKPHIARRGIKFNIPLDLRTPSYTDCSDAAQANIPVMWEREFWTALLDAMARHRYNVLSLWSLHPFPSLVKVPEFPDVALDDVWRTRAKLDDTFSFAREYILNMPPADKLAGFYMGPDGYVWGRDFLERHPAPGRRPLVMEKQWYSFMLWGRLAYDPSLPDSRFERLLAVRHPTASSHRLVRALQCASQVMPLTTRFFWGDIDLRWYPEACLSHPKSRGFYTVRHFMEGISMPGAEVLCIRDWRTRLTARQPITETTPLEIANALEGAVAETFAAVDTLCGPAKEDAELQKTVNDCESLAWLGRYYASKIRGACALALFDADGDKFEHAAALRHLSDALSHWKHYAAVRDAQYVPAVYNRVGHVDVTALTAKVAADIEIARNWKPSTLRDDGKRSGTERGFRK
jgi:hypothetical protein